MRQRIQNLNPLVSVETHDMKLDRTNALAVVEQYDVVLDGTDNFPARYLVNDACALGQKPYVYGSILRFEGRQACSMRARARATAACSRSRPSPAPCRRAPRPACSACCPA